MFAMRLSSTPTRSNLRNTFQTSATYAAQAVRIQGRNYAAAKKAGGGAPQQPIKHGKAKPIITAAEKRRMEIKAKLTQRTLRPRADYKVPLLPDGSEDFNSREYLARKAYYLGSANIERHLQEVRERVPETYYVADHIKEKMWRLHVADPDKWTLDELARRFEVERERAAAYILLKQIEHDMEEQYGPIDTSAHDAVEEEFKNITFDRIKDGADYVPLEKEPHITGNMAIGIEDEVDDGLFLRSLRGKSMPGPTEHLDDYGPPPELNLNEDAVQLMKPRIGPKELAKRRRLTGLKAGEQGGRLFFINAGPHQNNEEREILVMELDQSFRTCTWQERVKLLNYPIKKKMFKPKFDALMEPHYPKDRPNQKHEAWIPHYPFYKVLDVLARKKKEETPVPVENLPERGRAPFFIHETAPLPKVNKTKPVPIYWSAVSSEAEIKTPTDFDEFYHKLRKQNPKVRLLELVDDIVKEKEHKKETARREQQLIDDYQKQQQQYQQHA